MSGEFRKRELVGSSFVVTHYVDNSHDKVRTDHFLMVHYKHFSRNQIQTFIDEGRIKLLAVGDQKKLKASTRLQIGDQVQVITENTNEPLVDLEIKTLYEDDDLLIVDKPGNLPVHPAGKYLFNTLLMHLRKKHQPWISKGNDFYLVHRIDRETSGVLLLAKSCSVAAELVREFRIRNTEKYYYAITEGHLPEKKLTVDLEIGSDRNSHIRLKMAAFQKGTGELPALTHFEVLKRTENYDLLDCKLETGRQHQIRVHLAGIGVPVLGDKLYCKNSTIFDVYLENRDKRIPFTENVGPISRHALHSRYLKFFFPKQNRWIEVESELPPDMQKVLKLK